MKFFLLTILFILLFVPIASPQSVVVTSRKVTYKRLKPLADFKRTFTIDYSKVRAATPALSRRIEEEISYFKAFDFKVKDELTEYQWLEEADYEVLYNARGILSIILSIQGTGAYPDRSERKIVVDTKKGVRVRPVNIFINLNKLASILDVQLQAEISKAKTIEIENEGIEDTTLFEGKKFTAADLGEFIVTADGVTFYYDYGFPHAIQALEPEGKFLLSWEQLKPYARPAGLLQRFVS